MKCEGCPIAEGPCWAEAAHRRRHCRLVADGREDYRRLVVERTAAERAGEGLPALGDRWLAPLRRGDGKLRSDVPMPWEGSAAVKPWEWPVTVALVHLDTPDWLRASVALWRLQEPRPYLLVIDVGSHAEGRAAVEALEAEDLEAAFVRPRGWFATSEAVAVGMDVAFSLCNTEKLIGTHVDVFPKRRGLTGWMAGHVSAATPVAGWRMSPRPQWPEPLWREIPSHTCTAYFMPTMRLRGGRWSMRAAYDRLGRPPVQPFGTGFPDTEVNLGLQLAEWGVRRWDHGAARPEGACWLNLGDEPNEPYDTEWFRHERSYTGRRLFHGPGDARVRDGRAALEAAVRRARAWSGEAEEADAALGDVMRRRRSCRHLDQRSTCRAPRCDRIGGPASPETCAACPVLPA